MIENQAVLLKWINLTIDKTAGSTSAACIRNLAGLKCEFLVGFFFLLSTHLGCEWKWQTLAVRIVRINRRNRAGQNL